MAIGIAVSISISITWLVYAVDFTLPWKEKATNLLAWLYANFGSLTLGLILKFLMNLRHVHTIKKIVKGGEEMFRKEKGEKLDPIKFSQDFEIEVNDVKINKKNNKITFEFVGEVKDREKQLIYAFGELISLHQKE
ncbi:MAG: hypothetical protein ACRC63_01000 [Metamycoplasmataceae bacterium]